MAKKLTNFEELEGEKENYTQQRQGRSASLIAQLNRTPLEERHNQKEQYWRELLEGVQDGTNDPLTQFMDYIEFESHRIKGDWTMKRSNILDVVELCLMYCQKLERYTNDKRYLNVWLDYCTNFYSPEEQVDVLVYMYRSNVANQLSEYYSYFVDILIQLERYKEAYQVIKLGIESHAEPRDQLVQELKYMERDYVDGLDPPEGNHNLEQNITNIIQYNEPSVILNGSRDALIKEYQERQVKNNSKNFSIHNDVSETSNSGIFEDDTNNEKLILQQLGEHEVKFQSRKEKLKENRQPSIGKFEPESTNIKPLKQVSSVKNKRQIATKKLPIFNDDLGRSGPIYKIIYFKGHNPDKIDCNFDLLYPSDEEELSIEQLLAYSRRLRMSKRIHSEDESDNRIKRVHQ